MPTSSTTDDVVLPTGSQRLGIARAILQRPRVLILDEATVSLDAASEQQLLSGLHNILPGSTIIVISHRLSALLCVERVIVLEAGRVVEDASPAVLLRNGRGFSRLFSGVASAPKHSHSAFHGYETESRDAGTSKRTDSAPQ